MPRQPVLYLPHGGGPWPWMDASFGDHGTLRPFLEGLQASLPQQPEAVLVVSAHWERAIPTLLDVEEHSLYFDYGGFPAHTYELEWPVPTAPSVTARAAKLLLDAGWQIGREPSRGLDHGVFVPLKLAWPEADIPVAQVSLLTSLDAADHVAMGQALEPLRDEGVLIIGSGMSYHNMRGLMTGSGGDASEQFDTWMAEACALEPEARGEALAAWEAVPAGRAAHPREEHLLPLMVCAGGGGEDAGAVVFRDRLMGAVVSGIRFG